MYLPDRGSRRQCNRDAKGNNECHKDEFRAHGVASHFDLRPAGIWAAGAAIQSPGGASAANRITIPAGLFRFACGRGPSKKNPRRELDKTNQSRARRFIARNPFRNFVNLVGTGATRPSCSVRAKWRGAPIQTTAILLLDLAFF